MEKKIAFYFSFCENTVIDIDWDILPVVWGNGEKCLAS